MAVTRWWYRWHYPSYYRYDSKYIIVYLFSSLPNLLQCLQTNMRNIRCMSQGNSTAQWWIKTSVGSSSALCCGQLSNILNDKTSNHCTQNKYILCFKTIHTLYWTKEKKSLSIFFIKYIAQGSWESLLENMLLMFGCFSWIFFKWS